MIQQHGSGVAVIGERELVLGFRLIGMESAFEVNENNDVVLDH